MFNESINSSDTPEHWLRRKNYSLNMTSLSIINVQIEKKETVAEKYDIKDDWRNESNNYVIE